MPAINGRISSEQATEMGGTTVELINQTGDIVDQVQADTEGRFVLHVSSGTWRLKAYDPQGQRGETTVSVGDSDETVQLALA